MLEEQSFDADAMIRKARIKARGMQVRVDEGNWDNIVTDAYNVMFMAARGALAKLGVTVNTHQTVVAQYRRMIVEQSLVDKKFGEHLAKIKRYWENERNGQPEEVDQARATRIALATLELVDALAFIGDPSKGKVDPKLLHYN